MVERLSPSFLAPGESSWGQLLYIAAHCGTTVSVVKGFAIAGPKPKIKPHAKAQRRKGVWWILRKILAVIGLGRSEQA